MGLPNDSLFAVTSKVLSLDLVDIHRMRCHEFRLLVSFPGRVIMRRVIMKDINTMQT